MPLSAFLPAGYDARRPLVLIAGQGIYPILVAAAARAAGVPVRIVAFEEETRPELVTVLIDRMRARGMRLEVTSPV